MPFSGKHLLTKHAHTMFTSEHVFGCVLDASFALIYINL